MKPKAFRTKELMVSASHGRSFLAARYEIASKLRKHHRPTPARPCVQRGSGSHPKVACDSGRLQARRIPQSSPPSEPSIEGAMVRFPPAGPQDAFCLFAPRRPCRATRVAGRSERLVLGSAASPTVWLKEDPTSAPAASAKLRLRRDACPGEGGGTPRCLARQELMHLHTGGGGAQGDAAQRGRGEGRSLRGAPPSGLVEPRMRRHGALSATAIGLC